MSTTRQIIEDAHAEIGISADQFELTPEMLTSAKRRLVAMLNRWSVDGNPVAYSGNDDLDADSGIPATAEDAVVASLAVSLSPTFGKAASVETKRRARDGYQSLQRQRVTIPQMKLPTTTPLGAGNRRPTDQVFVADVADPLEPIDGLQV